MNEEHFEPSVAKEEQARQIAIPIWEFAPQFPFSRSLYFKYILTGILLPAICLVLSQTGMNPNIEEPWQSGTLDTYVALLLKKPVITVTFPFIIFSMVSFVAVLFFPSQRNRFWTLLGLVTGVVLALQYLVLFVLLVSYATLLAALFSAAGLALLTFFVEQFFRKFRRFSILHLMVLTAVVAGVVVIFQRLGWQRILLGGGLIFLVAAPTLNFISYLRVAASTLKHFRKSIYERKLLHVPFGLGWIVAYVINWKLSIDLMLVEYRGLPITDPNCFVSSAAANGHSWLVNAHSNESGETDQKPSLVNLQMQRLKFLEFTLKAVFPRVHAPIRKAYNQFGPILASCCKQNKLTADMTFLMLKPIEWTAIALRVLFGVSRMQIRQIYFRNIFD